MELWERSAMLELLDGLLGECARGGRVAVVAGEAGIGKSVLVNEFARRCGARARVLWGGCDRLVTPRALGPLHDIGRQTGGVLAERLGAGAAQEEIFAASLEELSGATGAPTAASGPGSAAGPVAASGPVAAASRSAFAVAPAAPVPPVVVVEDAHWADEATLDWLVWLGRRIGRLPALLVVTYRDDEVGAEHPIRGALAALPSATSGACGCGRSRTGA
ncbi:AAA family ATPase [[Actinomadura] parvosata]|uniref:AAA family ATPase n=1 Tax=[Actinomadura] parvosata TaxID=1955412 RepID=UPI00406CBED4